MERFRDTLVDYQLGDLGYHGSKYTWSNKRDSGEFVKERLDRAVAMPCWCAYFPNAQVEVLPVSNSYHQTIWLKLDTEFRMPHRMFRYEAKWNLDDEYILVVQNRGTEGETSRGPMELVVHGLEWCKIDLKAWSRAKFGSISSTIKSLSRRLESLQPKEHPGNLDSIKQVQGELNKLLEMEDTKWHQRAMCNWLQAGDRNTQYFHAWANQRRRFNFIGSVRDLEGHLCQKSKEI
jgi:hypothetical protein